MHMTHVITPIHIDNSIDKEDTSFSSYSLVIKWQDSGIICEGNNSVVLISIPMLSCYGLIK